MKTKVTITRRAQPEGGVAILRFIITKSGVVAWGDRKELPPLFRN